MRILLADLKQALTYIEKNSKDMVIQIEETNLGFLIGAFDPSGTHMQIVLYDEKTGYKPKVTSTTGLT